MTPEADILFTWGVDTLRLLADISTYWSQIVIVLAIAIERFIIISMGRQAKNILTPQRRRRIYSIIIVVIAVLPVCVLCDHFINYKSFVNNPQYTNPQFIQFNGPQISVSSDLINKEPQFVSCFNIRSLLSFVSFS